MPSPVEDSAEALDEGTDGWNVQETQVLETGEVRYTVCGPGGSVRWWRPLDSSFSQPPIPITKLQIQRTPYLLRPTCWRTLRGQIYFETEELSSYRPLSELISAHKTFREPFIWSILHQLASLAHKFASSARRILPVRLFFRTEHIFIDNELKLKADPFVFITDDPGNDENDFPPCNSAICSIGAILYEMCTFNKPTGSHISLDCGSDLKNIINGLLHGSRTTKCTFTSAALLHHPSLLLHLDDSKEIYVDGLILHASTPTSDSAFESDESTKIDNLFSASTVSNVINASVLQKSKDSSIIITNEGESVSPTIAALDLPGYLPHKLAYNVNKWASRLELYKEPQEVSENALSKVWLERLKTLKEREKAVELKEKEIAKKALFEQIRSTVSYDDNKPSNSDTDGNIPGITLQTVMSEKLLQADKIEADLETKTILPHMEHFERLPSRRRYHRSSTRKSKRRTIVCYEDLDSSLSADPGDSSVIMTSTKISSDTVQRPYGMCNPPKKKVHFNSRKNPFAEYDSVSSTVFTFDNNRDASSYVTPIKTESQHSILDRIAKFTYLDLEEMTKRKRDQMEEYRRSHADDHLKMSPPKTSRIVTEKRVTRKSKYLSPRLERCPSSNLINYYGTNSESSGISVTSYPGAQIKDRRKSMPFLSMSRSRIAEKKPTKENLSAAPNTFAVPAYNLRSKKTDVKTEKTEAVKTPANSRKRLSIFNFKTPFKI